MFSFSKYVNRKPREQYMFVSEDTDSFACYKGSVWKLVLVFQQKMLQTLYDDKIIIKINILTVFSQMT